MNHGCSFIYSISPNRSDMPSAQFIIFCSETGKILCPSNATPIFTWRYCVLRADVDTKSFSEHSKQLNVKAYIERPKTKKTCKFSNGRNKKFSIYLTSYRHWQVVLFIWQPTNRRSNEYKFFDESKSLNDFHRIAFSTMMPIYFALDADFA